jgi:hypothetical protein
MLYQSLSYSAFSTVATHRSKIYLHPLETAASRLTCPA